MNTIDLNENPYKKLRPKFKNVLHSSNFCAACFESDELKDLDEIILVENCVFSEFHSLRNIWNAIFSDQESMDPPSNHICSTCRSDMLKVYEFICNVKKNMEVVGHYVNQVDSKISELKIVLQDADSHDSGNTFIVIEDPDYSRNNCEMVEESMTESPQKDTPTELVKCKNCIEMFVSKKAMYAHRQKHHKDSIRQYKLLDTCPDCGTDDCPHQKYVEHCKKFNSGERISCPDCDFSCWKLTSLLGHANKSHLHLFPYICEHCAKPLTSKSSYDNHIRLYHIMHYNCLYCDKEYSDRERLEKHLIVCKNTVREFKCEQCTATFNTLLNLNTHVKKHRGLHPCNLCNRVFTNPVSLQRHINNHPIKSKEAKTSTYTCFLCDGKYPTLRDRNDHMKEHILVCKICETEFDNAKQYQVHLLNNHGQRNRKYKCEQCDYATDTSFTLEAHVNRYHLKIAPHKCTLCPRQFTDTMKLKVHMKIHTNLKVHQCKECNVKLCGATALKKHMRLHTGERPYVCDKCGERFISASMRQTHITKSHQEKTIKCPLCNSMFYTLNTMRMHFKKQHWKRDEKFDITKVEGLTEEDYDLFRDRRLLVLE